MHIYFSGAGGVGMGPLAEIALDAGHTVSGSDLAQSAFTKELNKRGANIAIGQDGSHLKAVHESTPIDWFVYTSALPFEHAELHYATKQTMRCSKRDELLQHILDEQKILLVAIAGTHGKTTTTALHAWIAKNLGLPASYLVGSTITFGSSGKLDTRSPYLFYECDEYDRNFLYFQPQVSVLTSVDYDHPDTYPTEADYKEAFVQFLSQSKNAILWQKDAVYILGEDGAKDVCAAVKQRYPNSVLTFADVLDESAYPPLNDITLAGTHMRQNAALAATTLAYLTNRGITTPEGKQVLQATSGYPSTGRRFEQLADNLYSDYGHHPTEIAATLQMAKEVNPNVVLVYQPHQNTRQHRILTEYKDAFLDAEAVYWLPTYLTREDPALSVLRPHNLIDQLSNKAIAQVAELDDELWQHMQQARQDGKLVLAMGAGTIDGWVRSQLAESNTSTE